MTNLQNIFGAVDEPGIWIRRLNPKLRQMDGSGKLSTRVSSFFLMNLQKKHLDRFLK